MSGVRSSKFRKREDRGHEKNKGRKELFEIGKERKYGGGGENKGNTVEVDFNLQWEHKGYINAKKWGEEGR